MNYPQVYYTGSSSSNTVAIIVLVVLIAAVIIWGIAGAVIASKRGRNPVGWFFMGAGFLFFGLFLLLLLPPLGGEYKRCPNCAQIIGIGARVCPHCQYSFQTRKTNQNNM